MKKTKKQLGRPPIPDKPEQKRSTLRMNADIHDGIEEKAKAMERSFNWYMTHLAKKDLGKT